MNNDRHINFKLLRDRVLAETANGGRDARSPREYWRSLEELAGSPEFEEFVRREFPAQAESWDDPIERRTFLKLMGASLALAGLSGCVIQPPQKIVPYVKQPEEEVPGKPLYFATAFSLGGIATPLLVKSNEGRPTKAEGNPDHPNNRSSVPEREGSSATDIFAQASILTLYDPDRAQTPIYRGEERPWSKFVSDIRAVVEEQKAKKGAGLRFLTETITSPTLGAQLRSILGDFPEAKWHQYEPANRDNARAGAVMAFGQPVNTIYDFSKADRVLSLGSDFLACLPGSLRYARDFAARRRHVAQAVSLRPDAAEQMNRLYVVESTPTTTGAAADHRFSVKPTEMEKLTSRVFLGLSHIRSMRLFSQPEARLKPSGDLSWHDAIINDLDSHRGASVVIVGDDQPPDIHALAHVLNDALNNVGKTVFYTDPVEANSVDQTQSLRELINDIDAGQVELLVILGGNPVYNTPIDLKLDKARLSKVKLRVHLSLYEDETSELCHWQIPEAHYLESWTDTRSYDGTVTIVQPLIAPLYEGKTAHELLAVFTDNYDRKPYDLVRDYWRGYRSASGSERVEGSGRMPANRPQDAGAPTGALTATPSGAAMDFEAWWRKCVHDGFIPNSALPTKSVSLKPDWTSGLSSSNTQPPKPNTLELIYRTDPTIHDGRFANNGWLQELPKPLTKLTWDNVALVSPRTADRLGLARPEIGEEGGDTGKTGGAIFVDKIRINNRGRTVTAPAWVMPGQPDDVITIHLGYGRRRAGRVGNDQGFDAYQIRASDAAWFATGAQVARANEQYQISGTQLHFNMEGRDILRASTLDEYLKDKERLSEEAERERKELQERSLYQDYDYRNQGNGYAWGMSIDLGSCVGCNACVVACQSENNIPVVGKEQVARRREMQWIRVDAYFKGDAENPQGPFFQPVPCMHCENAPCEPVCPVHATVHSAEGLNEMVYNRCVGTRYCSNNCPYKVRRFNFLLYQDWDTPTYQLMRNPEVSIRSRGVMEKCTYCVQRIQAAKIESEIEGRAVRDGEIVTACQAVCPTQAIVFGNVNDPNSRVSKLKAQERNYALLAELNTRPRTTYLSALRNPNPEI